MMALEIRARHNKRGFSKRHSILHDMLRVSLGFGILHQSIGANTGASDAKSLNTLIIDDQIQSLQLAQSYVDVSGLLRQVESTANTTNQVLGEVIARISLVSHGLCVPIPSGRCMHALASMGDNDRCLALAWPYCSWQATAQTVTAVSSPMPRRCIVLR